MTGVQTIDLTSALWTGNETTATVDTVPDLYIDWGDKTQINRTDCSDKSLFKHTYKKADNFTIKLHGLTRWYCAISTRTIPTPDSTDLSHFLISINIPSKCPIRSFCGKTQFWGTGGGFAWCERLTLITGDIFSGLEETATNINALPGTFYHTRSLTTLPILTWPTPIDGTLNLHGFFNTIGIKEISENIFSNIPGSVTSLNINDFFADLPITAIPANLFNNIPDTVTTITARFLFRNPEQLTTIPSTLFDGVPNTNQINFEYMFNDAQSFTGEIPAIWNTHSNIRHTGMFYGLKNASNYSEVPDDWKSAPPESALMETDPDFLPSF